jgi:phosphoribosylanthranilate isomerase
MPVKVKICGVRTVADAVDAAEAGDADTARAIVAAVAGVPCVGVFVDRPAEEVARLARALGLAAVQLHGGERAADCAPLRALRIVKALHARPGVDLVAAAAEWPDAWLLVDAWVPGVAGGTGRRVDPEALRGLPVDRLFVAGGLRPDTVADVIRRVRPFAVDVASGVERAPGVKDHGKVREFIRRAHAA